MVAESLAMSAISHANQYSQAGHSSCITVLDSLSSWPRLQRVHDVREIFSLIISPELYTVSVLTCNEEDSNKPFQGRHTVIGHGIHE